MLAPMEDGDGDEDGSEWVEIQDEPELEEEAAKIPIAPAPVKPSAREVEDHRIAHYPYRNWCIECLKGRGKGEQRGRHAGRHHAVPRLGIDYWFITSENLKRRKELAEEYPMNAEGDRKLEEDRGKGKIIKCIVIRCHESKAVLAHCVPQKGADEDGFVVDLVCQAVAWFGYTRLILKTDNEKALLSLVKQALEAVRVEIKDVVQISDEHSAEYDSQSNGGTEVGIRAVRGLFRTIKFCTERRIGQEIPVNHPLTAWLVEHVCTLLNALSVGTDGMTPWQRLRGRGFGQKLIGFVEAVMYKLPAKGPQHDVHGNMGERMSLGLFVGYNKVSNTYRIVTPDGQVVKARAILRRPLADRWRAEDIKNITATPWNTRTVKDAVRVEMGPEVERHPQMKDEVIVNPRRLKITTRTLREHGTTDGCPQCTHVRAFNEAKSGLQHSDACRKRILESMGATTEGAARIQRHALRADRHEEQVNQRLADHVEAADPSFSRVYREAPRAPQEGARAAADEADDANPEDGAGGAPAVEQAQANDDDESRCPRDSDDEMVMTIAELQEKIKTEPAKINPDDHDVVQVLALLGADPRSYRREKKQAVRRLVSEVYSPPRVTEMLKQISNHRLTPGLALDLTCTDPDDGQPWNFDVKEKRDKARQLLRQQKPLFLIGSPACTRWCSWQALNDAGRDPGLIRREKLRALVHLEFVKDLYTDQVEGGRFFLHEHPEGASSWDEDCIQEVLRLPEVSRVRGDQCQYGQEVNFGKYRGQPIKKPTGFMSNAPELLKRLSTVCRGVGGACSRNKGGQHALCSGRAAKEAAKYSKQLCKAIIEGMIDEMHVRGIMRRGEVGLHAVTDEDGTLPEGYSGRYRDDTTGQPLRDDLVAEARASELRYFCDKGVWVKRPKHEARARTGKGAISVRWVDVNKGDDMHPKYRSRLVARQMKAHDRSGTSFFAPTPPLEALRTVLSLAATTMGTWRPCYDPVSGKRTQISLVDISRAYFNAKLDPGVETYVQLPAEDEDADRMCAKLVRHMYGTRAAADGWQEEYSTFLVESLRFKQGLSSPCLFKHSDRQIVVSVHGDDFTAVGPKDDLDWYEAEMSKHYELTCQPRLGPGAGDAKEAVVLNRIIRWTHEGVEYEADPRQAEKLAAECGLDAGVNSVATPGLRLSFEQVEKDAELPAHLHTAFRGSAARANYLAVDRLDCQFAAKEICRFMSKPTEASWTALKRLCRYLVGLPRMVFRFRWQEASHVDVFTDTDWAGCPRTRKSTSGGCVILGAHAVKSWSTTQSSIALSSGEAEFNGVVKGAGVGLGYQSLLRDLGIDVPVRVWTDSSAAVGICSRQGLGKLRHIDTHTLWVQQAVRSKRIELRKVSGEVNPADLFTKHSLTREKLIGLTKLFDCEYRGGRAESAPKLRDSHGTKDTLRELWTVREGNDHATEIPTEPIIPHRVFDQPLLDRLYPPLGIGEDDEHMEEEDVDPILRHGMKLAEGICDQANAFGRRRTEKVQAEGTLRQPGSSPVLLGEGTFKAADWCTLLEEWRAPISKDTFPQ